MQSSVAAIRSRRTLARFVHPSGHHRERRFGLGQGPMGRTVTAPPAAASGRPMSLRSRSATRIEAGSTHPGRAPLRPRLRLTWTPTSATLRRANVQPAAPWRG